MALSRDPNAVRVFMVGFGGELGLLAGPFNLFVGQIHVISY